MRQGFAISHIDAACSTAAREGLEIVGVATHFANIEDTLDHQFARQQMRLFHRATSRLRHKLGATPPFVHAACSAATLLFREADYSMVRLGISMYGHWPSRETRLAWVLEHGAAAMELRPVLTWKARVGQLQDVRKGATVGYGRTWTALRRTRLAVIPVGYSDGYSRCLGNRARVLVRGCRAPVVGRVCMNIMMIDVTDVPGVQVGEEVVIIGSQDGATMAVEELASLSDTINYEFLARLSPSIPRLVVDSGQPPEVGASRGSLS
jgi:alanine racemase